MPKSTTQAYPIITCSPKTLPAEHVIAAADLAHQENAANRPPVEAMMALDSNFVPSKASIAVMTTKYWRTNGVRLTVGFLDTPPADLKARILSHMNAWSQSANVQFVESSIDPQVRISRGGGGYWSYIGTDILVIDRNQPTMNLEGFTMNTPDSEFHRVVRHETGHTLGCPHEHMRPDVVALIDAAKAIQYFGATQGWSPDQVRAQVLTPLDPSSIWGTVSSDRQSIMCYQLPGAVTKSGEPIVGGLDIDQIDYDFMAKVYPKPQTPALAPPAHAITSPAHDHDAHHACPACIGVSLPGGARLSVPTDVSEHTLRMLLGALNR